MWIMGQLRLGMVNTDCTKEIFINTKRNCIIARIDSDPENKSLVELGYYDSLEKCKDVLMEIYSALDKSALSNGYFDMPSRV